MGQIVVHKGRTNIISVSLGFDVSNDELMSEIRVEQDPTSDLLATWDVSFENDGTDGELILTLDDLVTSDIEKSVGYMDIKRVTAGEPISVFDEPLQVLFKNSVTA